MGLVETLIIVFGILCGFFLILLVLILWKYVKNIRKSKDGKFYKGVKTFPSMDEDDGVDVGPRVEWNFVAPQLPVEPYDPKALDDPKLTPSPRRKDYSKKPVNPKIRKLKKTKNMSRSLNSLDVIGKSEEIDLGSDHLSITTDETMNRSRRRSYGSDISDVSCTSSRCIKQEKINTQMMESLRNGKRKDSTMSISPKYNNGRLSLGNVGRNSTDGGPIKSPLANEPGRMSLDIGRNSPLVKKKWISLDDAPMSADNLSEYGSDFGGSSIALDESKSGSSNIRRRFAQTRNSNRSFEYKIVGNLIVSVEYKESDNKLTLWIHRASGLGGDRREDPEISSFVRMYLIPGKKQKQESSVIRGAKDPHYEETFTFNNIIPSELSAQKLRFKVYNSPSFSVKNELLGEGNIFLSTLKSDDKEVFHLDLLKKKSKISSASVEISLCHQGTYSKLEVIIHQAKNLVRKSNAMINPYAKVSFYKDGSVETKETTHQTNERNPIFNESLDFNANTDVGSPLTTYSLVVTIMHHSILRKDSPIGHVIFTLNSPQETAEKHFKMAENDPHRRITEWHKLIDPDDV